MLRGEMRTDNQNVFACCGVIGELGAYKGFGKQRDAVSMLKRGNEATRIHKTNY